MAFSRNNRRGPTDGTGDHRKGAEDAGEESGKEVKHSRLFGHHKMDKAQLARPSLPTYSGGSDNENQSASHPFFGRRQRGRVAFMPGNVLLDPEVERR